MRYQPTHFSRNLGPAAAFALLVTVIAMPLICFAVFSELKPLYEEVPFDPIFLLKCGGALFVYHLVCATVWQVFSKDGLWHFSSKIFVYFVVTTFLPIVSVILYSTLFLKGIFGLLTWMLGPVMLFATFLSYIPIKIGRLIRQYLTRRSFKD